MPKQTGVVRAVLFLAAGGLFGVSSPSVFAAPNVANGQRLYDLHCASCHGQDGVSVMQQAPNLIRFELFTQPDHQLIDVIRDGRNVMPPFLGILKETEMADVVGFIRTLH